MRRVRTLLTIPQPLLRSDGLPPDAPLSEGRTALIRSPLLRLLVFGCVLLFSVGFCAAVAALFFPISRVISATDSVGFTITIVGTSVAYIVILLLERRRPFELEPRRLGGLLVGLLAGAATFGVIFLLIVALGGYRLDAVASVDGRAIVMQVLAVGVGAGIAEELMFRGAGYRLLEESAGTWIAVVVSGVVFGFMHLSNSEATLWGAIAIAIEGGLLLGLLYALTRSLWVVIGYHAAWNVVQGPLLGVPISGNPPGPAFAQTVMIGPDWLTGGAFGTEASLVSVILVGVLDIVLAVALVRSNGVVAPRWRRNMRRRPPEREFLTSR